MSIATAEYIAEVGNFFETENLEYLAAPLRRASLILKRWTGATVYDAAAESGSGDAYNALLEAEALLAVAEALPAVNRADTGRGITLSVGTNSEAGSQTTRFLDPKQISEEQARLRSEAAIVAQDYLLSSYKGGLGPDFVSDSE